MSPNRAARSKTRSASKGSQDASASPSRSRTRQAAKEKQIATSTRSRSRSTSSRLPQQEQVTEKVTKSPRKNKVLKAVLEQESALEQDQDSEQNLSSKDQKEILSNETEEQSVIEDGGEDAKTRLTLKRKLDQVEEQHVEEEEDESFSQDGLEVKAASAECPYLDTIDRHRLDFDFEKICSVSLSKSNVYACLVCGRYFQGRGHASPAYFHSLEENHHVFLNLVTLKVYCLPDGYEVRDPSLNDIKFIVNPTFTKNQVMQLDLSNEPVCDINQKPYLPGFVGLNNVKSTDYLNVIIQLLAHIPPIRDFFLLQDLSRASELVQQFGLLLRKIWNPRAFKGQVSPHEFVQEVVNASHQKFSLVHQGDTLEFLSWFLNTLHRELSELYGDQRTVVYQAFQGWIQIQSQPVDRPSEKPTVRNLPFLMLTLDLPPIPLFTEEQDQSVVPQVPLSDLLMKFNGIRVQEIQGERRSYRFLKLPPYLIFHYKRFNKNNWTIEKNPAIVNFPIRNVDLGPYLLDKNVNSSTKYNLLANISHDGKPQTGQGTYKVHVTNKSQDQWFEIQDLRFEPVIPQMIFLSDSYIQVWEQQKSK